MALHMVMVNQARAASVIEQHSDWIFKVPYHDSLVEFHILCCIICGV